MNIKTVILSSAVVMAAMTTNAFAAKKPAAKANKNLTAQIEAGIAYCQAVHHFADTSGWTEASVGRLIRTAF